MDLRSLALMPLGIILFWLMWFSEHAESILAQEYYSDFPHVTGRIKEMKTAFLSEFHNLAERLPGMRTSHMSGFDYCIVEYEFDGGVRTALIRRCRKDQVGREIGLTLCSESGSYAVRTEYEAIYGFGSIAWIKFVGLALIVLLPLSVLDSDGTRIKTGTFLLALGVFLVTYFILRKCQLKYCQYIIAHRSEEWV